jgi:hypothetical protein
MISSKIITSISTRCFQLGTSGIVGLALAAALATGCQNPPAAAVADPGKDLANAGQSAPGALSIALVVPPNFQINAISYQLTNTTGFSQAGSLNVAQSGTVTGVIGGIPAGTGYTLALTASDVGQKFTSCAGSSIVAVTGGATTPVSVNIECRLPPQVTPPPTVPVPMPAVALLAVALLAGGAAGTRPRGRRAQNRPSDAPPSGKDR